MNSNSPSPRFGLSVALGALLVSVGGSAGAAPAAPADFGAAGGSRLELIPAARASALPPELRAVVDVPSVAEYLGLAEAAGSHRVQLRWVVREHGALSGYRVTLVAADGLPGNLAARWFVEPATGVPVGDGLTAYSTELSLALDEAAPVAAAVEAVDSEGRATLLGVRRSVAEAEPSPLQARSAASTGLSANPTVLQASGFAPTARAATTSPFCYPTLAAARLAAPPATLPLHLEPGGVVSPRGPPTATVTT